VDKFIFPADFVVMDMKEDLEVPLILGRAFMNIARILVNVHDGQIKLGVCDEEITFNVFESLNQLKDEEPCSRVDVLDEVIVDTKKQLHNSSPLEKVLIDAFEDLNNEEENEIEQCLSSLDGLKEIPPHKVNMKEMKVENKIEKVKNELSMLSPSLKCVSFKEDVQKQVVMSNSLSKVKKRRLKFLDLSRMRLHVYKSFRFYNSIAKKLKSKFSKHFTIQNAKPYGVVELEEPNWVVNGKRLKLYLGGEVEELTTIVLLNDP